MDELTTKYLVLSQQVEIVPEDYAQAWYKLALAFDIDGRPSMASACRSRGEFYYKLSGNLYNRITAGPFVELVQA